MSVKKVIRARGWVFTLNNVTEKDCFPSLPSGVKAIVYQLEKAPTTGMLHFQGYLETDRQVLLSTVKKIAGFENAHLEMRQGTPAQAYAYASKEESRVAGPWTLGEFAHNKDGGVAGQGKRSDLQDAVDCLKAGGTISTIMTEHPGTYARYPRGMTALAEFYLRSRMPSWRKVSVLVLQGRTGTGKTRKAIEVLALFACVTCTDGA